MVFYSWMSREEYLKSLDKEIILPAYKESDGLARRIAFVLAGFLFDDGLVLELLDDSFRAENGSSCYKLSGILTKDNHRAYFVLQNRT